MKRFKLFIPLIIFSVLAVFFWRGLSLDPSAMPSALIDKPFPEFSLPTLMDENNIASREDLLGSVTLVNIWATWCISCKVEHPYLNKLAKSGIKIVGVNYKDTNEPAKKWLNRLGNPYAWNVVDQQGTLGVDLGVFGAPETYLVDSEGIIRFKHVGVVNDRVWQEKFLPRINQLQ